MSVEDTDMLDMINESRTTGAVNLIISDHLPWDNVEAHSAILQQKIERYLRFIKSGEILIMHPKSADRLKVIQIFFLVPPPRGSATHFIEKMGDHVDRAGVGFEHSVFKGPI